MEKALPYAGWALLGALVLIWAVQKFLGKWIESAASAFQEWLIGRFAAGHWFRRAALRRYVAALLEDYDKIPVPFIEREDQRPSMRKIYVPLQTLDEDDRRLESDAYDNVRRSRRSVVLGPPGSGKSMLLKNSILIWAEDVERLTKERHFRRPAVARHRSDNVPVLVELRRCVASDGITGIRNLIIGQFADHGFARASRFVDRALYEGGLTILFDGLDEVATANRKPICGLLTDFASRYTKCQMVVTCRTAIYQGQLSEKFADIVRVADFDDAQIRRFMRNWQRRPADPVADQLFGVMREVPRLMQLARNPLLLTLISYLYAYRGKETKLPRSRAQFYKEATDFLLRNKPELDYSQSTKMAVLQRLALAAQDAPASDMDRQVLSYAKVISTIKMVLPATALGEDDVQPLLDEIVARSGIIKQIRGDQGFHFAHLTLQEFLAAAELADRPDDLIERYHSDPAIWRETIKLWCGYVSRDSKQVVSAVFESDPALAFECLADAVQLDEPIARKVTEYHEERLRISGTDDEAVVHAFGAVASDYGPRGQAVLSFLTDMARTPSDPRHAAALRALAASKLPHAADVLAELYPESSAASDALRTMGDLAVPAYASHAMRGELTAVDDLASIATPAAGRELVSLLASDTDTCTHAAWRIASMIQNPDVEETLRLSDELSTPSGPRLDAVWEPFRQESTTQWVEVMGRVSYLLDRSPDQAIPRVVNVDRRVAIPLCTVEIVNLLKKSSRLPLPDEFAQILEQAANSRRLVRPGEVGYSHILSIATPHVSEQGRIELSRWELARLLPAIPDDAAPAMFKNILQDVRVQEIGVRKVHQALFAELAPKVQQQIFRNACGSSRRRTTLADWPDSFTPRAIPRVATYISGTLTGIASVSAVVLAIYSLVEIIRGTWIWGPSWLAWIAIALVPLSIVFFIIALQIDVLFDPAMYACLWGLAAGVGLLVFFAAIAVRQHSGWAITAVVFALTLMILSFLWRIVYARNLAIANPMRGLLEVDEQAARNRTSIVA
jgi:hypothetical protein